MSSVQLPTTPPSVPVLAAEALYRQLFEKNRAVQLLIDPTSGRILDANPAACTFYGYKHEELTRMRITEINTLSEEEVIQEMQRAVQKKRLFFCFRHRLASGAERDVEIYTSPMQTQDGVVLHSIIHDVTSRVEAEQQLRFSNAQLRKLAARSRSVREEEQTRLAREVHDVLGQALTALKFDVKWLHRHSEPMNLPLQEKLHEIDQAVEAMIETVQKIATELRPSMLDQLGLAATLAWQTKRFEKRTGIHSTFSCEREIPPLDQAYATALFRILQESLTNVARHASATQVTTSLTIQDGSLVLRIADDGRGIEQEKINAPESLGILSMRERAAEWRGALDITKIPGAGTLLTVRMPLDHTTAI